MKKPNRIGDDPKTNTARIQSKARPRNTATRNRIRNGGKECSDPQNEAEGEFINAVAKDRKGRDGELLFRYLRGYMLRVPTPQDFSRVKMNHPYWHDYAMSEDDAWAWMKQHVLAEAFPGRSFIATEVRRGGGFA
jgi:hypothetical protein